MATVVGIRPVRAKGGRGFQTNLFSAVMSQGPPKFINGATAARLRGQGVGMLGPAQPKAKRMPKVYGSGTRGARACAAQYAACKLAAPHGASRHAAYLSRVRRGRAAGALRRARADILLQDAPGSF